MLGFAFVLPVFGVLIALIFGIIRCVDDPGPREGFFSQTNKGALFAFASALFCFAAVGFGLRFREYGGCEGGYKDQGHCTHINDSYAAETGFPLTLAVLGAIFVGLPGTIIAFVLEIFTRRRAASMHRNSKRL